MLPRSTFPLLLACSLSLLAPSASSASCLGTRCGAATGLRAPAPPTPPPAAPLPLAGDGAPAAIACRAYTQFVSCSCNGENSRECDLLFLTCDVSGGLFQCASDYGSIRDTCECMYYY
jgi:hypothetical protein